MNRMLKMSCATTSILPTKCIDQAPKGRLLFHGVRRTGGRRRRIAVFVTLARAPFGVERLHTFFDSAEDAARLVQEVADPLDIRERVVFLSHEIFVLTLQSRDLFAAALVFVLLQLDFLRLDFNL